MSFLSWVAHVLLTAVFWSLALPILALCFACLNQHRRWHSLYKNSKLLGFFSWHGCINSSITFCINDILIVVYFPIYKKITWPLSLCNCYMFYVKYFSNLIVFYSWFSSVTYLWHILVKHFYSIVLLYWCVKHSLTISD